ncbi:hypothetical protein KKC87_04515 [Patescibacteria group bacterium]|nr:hypothetical protein [Patescibacteria group bacterium]
MTKPKISKKNKKRLKGFLGSASDVGIAIFLDIGSGGRAVSNPLIVQRARKAVTKKIKKRKKKKLRQKASFKASGGYVKRSKA